MLIVGTILLFALGVCLGIFGLVLLLDAFDGTDAFIGLFLIGLAIAPFWGGFHLINVQKHRTHGAIYRDLKSEGWNIPSNKITVGYNTGHVYLNKGKCQVTLMADRFNGKFHLWVQGADSGTVVGGKYLLNPDTFKSFDGICP